MYWATHYGNTIPQPRLKRMMVDIVRIHFMSYNNVKRIHMATTMMMATWNEYRLSYSAMWFDFVQKNYKYIVPPAITTNEGGKKECQGEPVLL